MDVLVFKTNVRYKKHVHDVKSSLNALPEIIRWNFDFADADRILRIEANDLLPTRIEKLMEGAGYYCKELE